MSDMTLYKISQEFESLIDLIERDVLEDWEKEELKKKISNVILTQGKEIVKYYISEMADIEALKNEINRLKIIKSSKEAKMEKLKDRLTENMRVLKCKKIPTPLGNITLALDSVTKTVEVNDDVDFDKIPQEYVKVSKEIRKTDIKKAMEDGATFEGVELVSKPSRVVFRLEKESKDFIEEVGNQ